MEEAGRALLPGPFFSTVVQAGSVIDAVSNAEHKKNYLAPICAGDARSTVGVLEASASWDPSDVKLAAANGRLSGDKLFVTDAAVANFIVVVARNGVFVWEAKASGMRITPMSGRDLTRKLYAVHFHNTPADTIGETGPFSNAFYIP